MYICQAKANMYVYSPYLFSVSIADFGKFK